MTAGDRVGLVGGPLSGSLRTWPSDEHEATFVVAEIVGRKGVTLPVPEVIEVARYRVLLRFVNLLMVRAVARHVG